MKTKTIWEKEDLKAGRWIIRESSTDVSKNVGFACSVTYKLCWNVGDPKWSLVAMTDGMIGGMLNDEEMLKRLNDDRFGYRPLTYTEILSIVEYSELQMTGMEV